MENLTIFDNSVETSGYSLKTGDVLESNNLGNVYFDRWSRGMKSYLCVQIATGKRYKTRVAFTRDTYNVIGKYKIVDTATKYGDDSKNLTKGELFVIERKTSVEILRFVEYGRTGKITACSVLDDKKQYQLDKSFTVIKVAKL